jgi:hypothetical protein
MTEQLEQLNVMFEAVPARMRGLTALLAPHRRWRAVLTADGVPTKVICSAPTRAKLIERCRYMTGHAEQILVAMDQFDEMYHRVRRQRALMTTGVAVGQMIELTVAVGRSYPVGTVCQVIQVDVHTTITKEDGNELRFPVVVAPLDDSGEPEDGVKIPLSLDEYNLLEKPLV